MKIVINHYAPYKEALTKLFESLHAVGFNRFIDVVVVRTGSKINAPPSVTRVGEITECKNECADNKVVLVEMLNNNFDYLGFHALYVYKEDKLIADDNYLYLLDTVTFDTEFLSKFEKLQCGLEQIATSPFPCSNICLFGKKVVENYKDNFLPNNGGVPYTSKNISAYRSNNFTAPIISKRQAILLESNKDITLEDGTLMRSLGKFGDVFISGYKRRLGEECIYTTGFLSHPRIKVHFPYLGVFKWIGVRGWRREIRHISQKVNYMCKENSKQEHKYGSVKLF